LETKVPSSKEFILLPSRKRKWAYVGRFDGILFNPDYEQLVTYPSASHLHSSGPNSSNFTGKISNHNQNITAGVVSSSDTKTTVTLDVMVTCFNLQRKRERNCS
jgi:hypothetical protein